MLENLLKGGNRRYLSSLLILIAGIMLGIGIGFFAIPGKKIRSKKSNAESEQTVESLPPSMAFINPSAINASYHQYQFEKLEDLEMKVMSRIQEMKKGGNLTSCALYFRDLTNESSFGYNEDEKWTPASLLKVPVMIAVFKLAEINPNILHAQMIYVDRQEHIHTQTDKSSLVSNTVLINNLSYSIDQLVEIMIVDSDNEATILLINYLEKTKPGHLDKVQRDLGLNIDNNLEINDDFITVRKYSSFFRTLYNASYLNANYSEKALSILSKSGYGYGIRQAVPKDVRVSHKFGDKTINDEHFQLHHFAIVYHPKKPYLLGVMTRGKEPEKLKEAIASMAELIYQEIDREVNTSEDSYIHRDLK